MDGIKLCKVHVIFCKLNPMCFSNVGSNLNNFNELSSKFPLDFSINMIRSQESFGFTYFSSNSLPKNEKRNKHQTIGNKEASSRLIL